MRTFDVYKNSQGSCEAIKHGFSWPGFFFTFIWSLLKKLWMVALGIFILFFVLSIVSNVAEATGGDSAALIGGVVALIQIGVCIFVGSAGNNWRRTKLINSGYSLVATMQASSPDVAIHQAANRASA